MLGPLLLLAPVAGVIADMVDRRRYLITMETLMLVCAFVLAGYVWQVDSVSTTKGVVIARYQRA